MIHRSPFSLGFLAAIALAGGPIPACEAAGSETAGKQTLFRHLDPCALASGSRLRQPLQAALAFTFPLTARGEGLSLTISDPELRRVSCPALSLAARARARLGPSSGIGRAIEADRVRLRGGAQVRVEYRAPVAADQPEDGSDVWSARLCLSRLEIASVDAARAHHPLAEDLLRACLRVELPGWSGCRDVAAEACVDVTPLAQTFVARGGRFERAHAVPKR